MSVTSVEELVEATRWWYLLTRTAPLRLELPGMDEEQSRLLQSTIDRYMGTCGCREGQIGIVFAVALFVLLMLIEPSSIYAVSWVAIVGAGIGVSIMGALIGKITGVFRAGILLRKSIRSIRNSPLC